MLFAPYAPNRGSAARASPPRWTPSREAHLGGASRPAPSSNRWPGAKATGRWTHVDRTLNLRLARLATMSDAMAAQTTWLVLLRDVSQTIRVRGEKRVAACMVLDMNSGDVLGIHMGRSDPEAIETALRNAVNEPANRQHPKSPDRIVCSPEISPRVREFAGKLGVVEVIEASTIPEGEEVFDSFIGHMSGRKQPREFASPDEWRLLFETALRYCEAEPWIRWGDHIDLEIEVVTDGAKARYAGVVIGQEGLQRGLALYPGDELPAGVRDWEEGREVAMPPGTLLLHLDPPKEPPAEFVAKARRYGWPHDAEFLPVDRK